MKLIAMLMMSGKVFTMCDGGPVPEDCCDPGDRLDVIIGEPVDRSIKCDDMGGWLVGAVCTDVDF